MLLVYNSQFMELTVGNLKRMSKEEYDSIIDKSKGKETDCLYNAVVNDSDIDKIRFYLLIDNQRLAKLIADDISAFVPAQALFELRKFLIAKSNHHFILNRRKAAFWIRESIKYQSKTENCRLQFSRQFGRENRVLAGMLFDALITNGTNAGMSFNLKFSAESGYTLQDNISIEDAIDDLAERNSSAANAVLCRKIKGLLSSEQDFYQEYLGVDATYVDLLYTSLLNKKYIDLMSAIKRDDWVNDTGYLSQSIAIMLFDLYLRFGM